MSLPIATVISLVVLAAEHIIGYDRHTSALNMIILLIAEGIWGTIGVGMQVFFWLTVIFAIIERVSKSDDATPLTPYLTEWKVEDLKDIQLIPKQKAIPKYEVFGGLIWTAICATVYFYADHLIGIYKGGPDELELVAPALNEAVLVQYWPIILLIVCLEISLSIFKLIERQWTKGMAWFNALLQILSAIAFVVIMINPDLFHPDFTEQLADMFTIPASKLEMWLIGIGSCGLWIAAMISIVDGFRKAKV